MYSDKSKTTLSVLIKAIKTNFNNSSNNNKIICLIVINLNKILCYLVNNNNSPNKDLILVLIIKDFNNKLPNSTCKGRQIKEI